MPPNESDKPKLDLGALGIDQQSLVTSITEMFTGFVTDVTSPEFQAIAVELASDSLRIATMKAKNARPKLIEEAKADLNARLAAVMKVPGLVTSGREMTFNNFATRLMNGLIEYGFASLRYYAGLPPVPPPLKPSGEAGR